jgi:UDP-N-acetylmuramate dehydrogenase
LIYKDEPLSKHTSFNIGGNADYFIEVPNQKSLLELLNTYPKEKIFFLGSGTNVLFSDNGFRGIVAKLTGDFKKFAFDGNRLSCKAGANLAQVLKASAAKGLAGLECCAGIPGTVGGAVFGNAGNSKRGICEAIESVEIVNNGISKVVDNSKMSFSYRKSGIIGVIINVNFMLTVGNENDIVRQISDNLTARLGSQPHGLPNAGCIFKNPKGFSAGYLIDKAGLKGKQIGGAKVSDIHANFIVNAGGASAIDVLALIELIKERVNKNFSINLEQELRIVNEN